MRSRVMSRSAVAALLLVPLAASACATGPSADVPGEPSQTASRTLAPGITEWAQGTVEAAGWVAWVDVEGGFWALEDAPRTSSSVDRPKIVAVLLPSAATEKAIEGLEGRYAVATGALQGGASIRMAGPELVVDTIALALSPTR